MDIRGRQTKALMRFIENPRYCAPPTHPVTGFIPELQSDVMSMFVYDINVGFTLKQRQVDVYGCTSFFNFLTFKYLNVAQDTATQTKHVH